MAALNMRQKDLVQSAGLKAPTLSSMMNGTRQPGAESLLDICAALQCDPYWLLLGKGPEPVSTQPQSDFLTVPVLDSEDLPKWLSKQIQGKEFLPCPIKNAPQKAFALRVKGIAMEPKFSVGDVVFADPEQTDLAEGKFIIYHPKGESDNVQIKQFQLIDKKGFFISLNQQLPGELRFTPVCDGDVILGRVIAHLKQI